MNNNVFNLQYFDNNISEMERVLDNELKSLVYTKVLELNVEYAHSKEPVKFSDKDKLEYKPLKVGESWGELFDCAWFHLSGKYANNDSKKIYLALDVSGEALLYSNDGYPLKGFTNGSSAFDTALGKPGKFYYEVTSLIENNELNLYLDCGCNDLFGNVKDNGALLYANLVTKNDDIEKLYYDYEVVLSLLKTLDRDDEKFKYIFETLSEVKNKVLYQNENWINDSLSLLEKVLGIKSTVDHEVTAVGHAHIDLAWLWPIRESKRKAMRTLANVFYLIEKYDDFKFVLSQPQLIEWVKENNFDFFNKLKEYEKQGRIELVGGMWVEADTNLTGEESLVRQMLYGQNYYLKEFGHRVNNLWLPDVFGYSAAIPQIMKLSCQEYFTTIKISWCLINKFPYHDFIWNGIGDNQVLVHLPEEGTYNSPISPATLRKIEDNVTEKDFKHSLAIYGIGDGGGGPGDEHVERLHREESLYSLPKAKSGKVTDFFQKLEEKKDTLNVYSGELYLENHQGTYTSQSDNKYWNNYLESKLKTVETYLVLNNKDTRILEDIWKEILLYQFHDILPGSAIQRVYKESVQRYKEIDKQLDEIVNNVDNSFKAYKVENNHLFNPTKDILETCEVENDKYTLLSIAPFSTNVLSKRVNDKYTQIKNNKLETKDLSIKLDKKGYFTSIVDKNTNRELVINKANALCIFKDFGDAWNILDHYRKQDIIPLVTTKQIVNEYNDLYVIKQSYTYDKTTIEQEILINKLTNRIDVTLDCDWQSMNRMLRSVSDFTIKADNAIADIQFGHFARSRLNDTSIHSAQFEICAQKWMTIADKENSVSIISPAKHGYYVKESTLDINLLRSTNYPCVNGDIGKHTIKYSYFIKDDDDLLKVDQEAERINIVPLYTEKEINSLNLVETSPEIQVSAVKTSEDGKGTIVRLYNRTDKKVKSTLSIAIKHSELFETNLLEDVVSKVNDSYLEFKPFEIKTLLLK